MRAYNGYTLQIFCRLASAGIRGGMGWGVGVVLWNGSGPPCVDAHHMAFFGRL